MAHKLEDPDRPSWLPPSEVLFPLGLRAGMVVADIGAGTGYFTLPIARIVSPTGRVFAVDAQEEMLELLRRKLDGTGAAGTVELVAGEAGRTNLADASCDAALVANVWHELDDPPACAAELRRILRPEGRAAILDWRPDAARPPGPPIEHRVGPDRVEALLRAAGWSVAPRVGVGPYSYLIAASPRPLTGQDRD